MNDIGAKSGYQFRPALSTFDLETKRPIDGPLFTQSEKNLNHLRISVDGADHDGLLKDYSGKFVAPLVRVHFRELVFELAKQIREADMVVGAVAWLTHPLVLETLAGRKVAIVVQKEDFLRPDDENPKKFNRRLRSQYDALTAPDKFSLPGVAAWLNSSCLWEVHPVRCVGNHNRQRKPAHPRMHNKFMVFCRQGRGDEPLMVPYAVWTGSFNMTQNATNSFENAVYIECPQVAEAYANEWAQIFALSEPLDWESDWCAPEFRIGT